MDLNLAGKSAIVTGGGSNIGGGTVHAFAREGAHVAIAEIDAGAPPGRPTLSGVRRGSERPWLRQAYG